MAKCKAGSIQLSKTEELRDPENKQYENITEKKDCTSHVKVDIIASQSTGPDQKQEKVRKSSSKKKVDAGASVSKSSISKVTKAKNKKQKVSSSGQLMCDMCAETFANVTDFRRHQATHIFGVQYSELSEYEHMSPIKKGKKAMKRKLPKSFDTNKTKAFKSKATSTTNQSSKTDGDTSKKRTCYMTKQSDDNAGKYRTIRRCSLTLDSSVRPPERMGKAGDTVINYEHAVKSQKDESTWNESDNVQANPKSAEITPKYTPPCQNTSFSSNSVRNTKQRRHSAVEYDQVEDELPVQASSSDRTKKMTKLRPIQSNLHQSLEGRSELHTTKSVDIGDTRTDKSTVSASSTKDESKLKRQRSTSENNNDHDPETCIKAKPPKKSKKTHKTVVFAHNMSSVVENAKFHHTTQKISEKTKKRNKKKTVEAQNIVVVRKIISARPGSNIAQGQHSPNGSTSNLKERAGPSTTENKATSKYQKVSQKEQKLSKNSRKCKKSQAEKVGIFESVTKNVSQHDLEANQIKGGDCQEQDSKTEQQEPKRSSFEDATQVTKMNTIIDEIEKSIRKHIENKNKRLERGCREILQTHRNIALNTSSVMPPRRRSTLPSLRPLHFLSVPALQKALRRYSLDNSSMRDGYAKHQTGSKFQTLDQETSVSFSKSFNKSLEDRSKVGTKDVENATKLNPDETKIEENNGRGDNIASTSATAAGKSQQQTNSNYTEMVPWIIAEHRYETSSQTERADDGMVLDSHNIQPVQIEECNTTENELQAATTSHLIDDSSLKEPDCSELEYRPIEIQSIDKTMVHTGEIEEVTKEQLGVKHLVPASDYDSSDPTEFSEPRQHNKADSSINETKFGAKMSNRLKIDKNLDLLSDYELQSQETSDHDYAYSDFSQVAGKRSPERVGSEEIDSDQPGVDDSDEATNRETGNSQKIHETNRKKAYEPVLVTKQDSNTSENEVESIQDRETTSQSVPVKEASNDSENVDETDYHHNETSHHELQYHETSNHDYAHEHDFGQVTENHTPRRTSKPTSQSGVLMNDEDGKCGTNDTNNISTANEELDVGIVTKRADMSETSKHNRSNPTKILSQTIADKNKEKELEYWLKEDQEYTRRELAELKKPRPYQCQRCKRTFISENDLLIHYLVHIGGKTYPCRLCGRTFMTVESLKKHRYVHKIQDNLRLLTKDGAENQKSATKKTSAAKTFSCSKCSKKFGTKTQYILHTKSPKAGFLCKICSKVFPCKGFLLQHHLESHKSLNSDNTCSECGRTFYKAAYIEHHLKEHSLNCGNICIICGRFFRLKRELTDHIETNHTSGIYRHICQICGHPFSGRPALREHKQFHRFEAEQSTNKIGKKRAKKDRVINQLGGRPTANKSQVKVARKKPTFRNLGDSADTENKMQDAEERISSQQERTDTTTSVTNIVTEDRGPQKHEESNTLTTDSEYEPDLNNTKKLEALKRRIATDNVTEDTKSNSKAQANKQRRNIKSEIPTTRSKLSDKPTISKEDGGILDDYNMIKNSNKISDTKRYNCEKCGLPCSSYENLHKHIDFQHSESSESSKEDWNPSDDESQESSDNDYTDIEPSRRKQKCRICGKVFVTSSSLLRHMHVQHRAQTLL